MRKRVVVLVRKNSGAENIYPTVVDLLKRNKDVGITLNALWNALSKGKGKYENRDFLIFYRKQAEPMSWK